MASDMRALLQRATARKTQSTRTHQLVSWLIVPGTGGQ